MPLAAQYWASEAHHHRRAAEVGHAFGFDQAERFGRVGTAQADVTRRRRR